MLDSYTELFNIINIYLITDEAACGIYKIVFITNRI